MTQAVFLVGLETWVLTARIENALDSFQSRVARKITGKQTQGRKDGRWFYPPVAGVMKVTGLVRIWKSILWRQNTVAQFIATQPILDLCKNSTWRPGARVARRWWEQMGIDWKGARERAAASAVEPGTEAVLDLESENAMDGAVGGTGEEESLGASGYSGADWSGVDYD